MADPLSIDRYQWPTEILQDSVVHTKRDGDGNISTDRWRQGKQIGVGGQGAVWLQRHVPKDELRAVKRIPKQSFKDQGIKFTRELNSLLVVSSHREAFIQLHGWYQDADWYYIAMEYAKYGDLDRYVKEFTHKARSEVREITRQLLQALDILHGERICHRDLKPQNILISSRSPIHVKIADFGLSKSLVDSEAQTQVGTRKCLAPELQGLFMENQRGKYPYAVDIWSLGCVVYLILTSEIPFLEQVSDFDLSNSNSGLGNNGESHIRQVNMQQYSEYCAGGKFPSKVLIISEVTDEGISFMRRMLRAAPSTRLLPEEALQESWLSEDPTTKADQQSVIKEQLLSLGIKKFGPNGLRKIIDECGEGYGLNEVELPGVLPKANIGDLRFRAATHGYISVLHVLLRLRSDCEIDFPVHEWTPLQSAALRGHSHVVRVLLKMNANVNAPPAPKNGRTALQAAAQAGSVETVELLLAAHADVHAEPSPSGGVTAIEAARKAGHERVVQLLERSITRVNGQVTSNVTPYPSVVEVEESANRTRSSLQSLSQLLPAVLPGPILSPVVSETRSAGTQTELDHVQEVARDITANESSNPGGPIIEVKHAQEAVEENNALNSLVLDGTSFEDKASQTDERRNSDRRSSMIEMPPEETLPTSQPGSAPRVEMSTPLERHQSDKSQAPKLARRSTSRTKAPPKNPTQVQHHGTIIHAEASVTGGRHSRDRPVVSEVKSDPPSAAALASTPPPAGNPPQLTQTPKKGKCCCTIS